MTDVEMLAKFWSVLGMIGQHFGQHFYPALATVSLLTSTLERR
jgi:hypothetical protein